jgi:putative transposase
MISVARTVSRNVKNWQSGDMGLRWTAAGMLEAEKKFKRVMGYAGLARLAGRLSTSWQVLTSLSKARRW